MEKKLVEFQLFCQVKFKNSLLKKEILSTLLISIACMQSLKRTNVSKKWLNQSLLLKKLKKTNEIMVLKTLTIT